MILIWSPCPKRCSPWYRDDVSWQFSRKTFWHWHKKSLLEFGAWRRDRRGWRAWDVGAIMGGERDGSIVVTKLLVIMMSDARHDDDGERPWALEAVDDVVVAEAETETQKLKLCATDIDLRHDSIVLIGMTMVMVVLEYSSLKGYSKQETDEASLLMMECKYILYHSHRWRWLDGCDLMRSSVSRYGTPRGSWQVPTP